MTSKLVSFDEAFKELRVGIQCNQRKLSEEKQDLNQLRDVVDSTFDFCKKVLGELDGKPILLTSGTLLFNVQWHTTMIKGLSDDQGSSFEKKDR